MFNIKVEKSNLNIFREMLETESRKDLIEFFDKYIFQEEKQRINALKKIMYTLMTRYKNLGDLDKSCEYYNLYQDLKNGKIKYEYAYEKFLNII